MPEAVSSTPVVSNVNDLMTTQKQVTSPNPNGELGKDAFLKLLVAQLKYQDPSSPVDSSQFMAQTAAFTQVEKLDAMAKDSSANLALQQGLAASALVGRTVSYVDDKGITQRGVVTSASFGGSGSAEPSVHIGDTAVPLSSIVSVDDGRAPAPVPDGDASEVTPETDADTKTAEQKAAEQRAMTDAISAALTQAFAGGVTGSIADAVAQAVAAAMAAAGTSTTSTTTTSTSTSTTSTTSTTGMDATTSGTGTDATNGTTAVGTTAVGTTTDGTTTDGSTTSTSPATAGPTS